MVVVFTFIHTPTVFLFIGLWSHLKLRMSSRHGAPEGKIQDLLDEFSYRYMYGGASHNIYMQLIADCKAVDVSE